MRIQKHDQNYQVILSHEELLTIINGLGARNLLIRDIAGVISPSGNKKVEKELHKLHEALAQALPADAWG